jgi:hypothetical protein
MCDDRARPRNSTGAGMLLRVVLRPRCPQLTRHDRGERLPSPIAGGIFDLILAADCVYFEPAFPLLVDSLCDLSARSPAAEILFCYKKRRKVRN